MWNSGSTTVGNSDNTAGATIPNPQGGNYTYSPVAPFRDEHSNTLDKFQLHGRELLDYLDGGSALHLNLEEKLDQRGYVNLLNIAAQTGCNYFCVNVKITICNSCEAIDKRTLCACAKCGSTDIDYGTRVIGYLKRVSAFSSGRRREHSLRHYQRQQTAQEQRRA